MAKPDCSMGRQYGLVVTLDGQTTISALVDGGQVWSVVDSLSYSVYTAAMAT